MCQPEARLRPPGLRVGGTTGVLHHVSDYRVISEISGALFIHCEIFVGYTTQSLDNTISQKMWPAIHREVFRLSIQVSTMLIHIYILYYIP